MARTCVLIPGDGIGPEVCDAAVRVLEKLARALKPGGVLVVFDAGGAPPVAFGDRERFDRLAMAFLSTAAQTGWDLAWAPNLPQQLAQLGLADVRARAFRDYVAGSHGGFPGFVAASIEQLRERLLATGWLEPADLDAISAALRDPACAFLTFECWAASARQPD